MKNEESDPFSRNRLASSCRAPRAVESATLWEECGVIMTISPLLLLQRRYKGRG